MSKKSGLILAVFLAGATPAFAQAPEAPAAACVEPVAPPPVDGATIDQPHLVAGIAAAKDFIAKSDLFQTCISDDLEAQKAAAIKNQTPFDPAVSDAATARLDANQKMKVKVGANINTAISVYKNAHAK